MGEVLTGLEEPSPGIGAVQYMSLPELLVSRFYEPLYFGNRGF